MSKHTPGPWKKTWFERKEEKEYGYVIQADIDQSQDQDDPVVAWIFTASKNAFGNVQPSDLPGEANANLIAAAPELLQLAYAFHTYLKDCPDDSMESLVKKTIAKTEGRE